MDNIKPWQIILLVAAVAVLGFSVVRYGLGSNPADELASSLTLVDVETGQLYTASIKGPRSLLIPAPRPDSQDTALIPVFEEDGNWYLFERYRQAVNDVTVPTTAVTDPDGPVAALDAPKIKY